MVLTQTVVTRFHMAAGRPCHFSLQNVQLRHTSISGACALVGCTGSHTDRQIDHLKGLASQQLEDFDTV